MIWVANSGLSVELRDTAFKMVRHQIKRSLFAETGGILIGRYGSNQMRAIIEQATGPGIGSLRSRFSFVRGTRTLQRKLDSAAVEGLYYLGEWHCHPGAYNSPSKTDIDSMRHIAGSALYHCPEPVLIVFSREDPENLNSAILVYRGNIEELMRLDIHAAGN